MSDALSIAAHAFSTVLSRAPSFSEDDEQDARIITDNTTRNKVKANLPGGALTIEWQGNTSDTNHCVYMTVRAAYSFSGEVYLNN